VYRRYPFLVGAMRATIEIFACFDSMADDLATTMFTFRREAMNGAFKAVEEVRSAVAHYFQRFVVFVSADFTVIHTSENLLGLLDH
jgi:hypothetical protein